ADDDAGSFFFGAGLGAGAGAGAGWGATAAGSFFSRAGALRTGSLRVERDVGSAARSADFALDLSVGSTLASVLGGSRVAAGASVLAGAGVGVGTGVAV